MISVMVLVVARRNRGSARVGGQAARGGRRHLLGRHGSPGGGAQRRVLLLDQKSTRHFAGKGWVVYGEIQSTEKLRQGSMRDDQQETLVARP